MGLEEGTLFEYEDIKFMVMSTLEYGGVKYYFTNRINDEMEPTGQYVIYYEEDGELQGVENKEIMEILIPIFQEKITEKVDEIEEMENNQ